MNCCQLLRALQISDDTSKFKKQNTMQMNGSPMSNQSDLNQMTSEIQCKDISQSQMSPVVQPQSVQKPAQLYQQPQQTQQTQQTQLPQQQITNMYASSVPMQLATQTSAMPPQNLNGTNQQTSMRPDIYQRTLEYVQSCQSWAENSETVTSTSNMQINDMSTSLSSLLEENRYYNSVL